jgi:hypothetical protein
MHIHFYGPYPLCSEEHDVLHSCEHASKGGVYLWAVPNEEHGFLITYIGETERSFYHRTKDHLIQALGGNYAVADPAPFDGDWHTVWRGLWRKGTRDKPPEFLANYEELVPKIKANLLAHRIFVAPFDCERRLRRRIEGALAAGVSDTSCHLMSGDIRYSSRKKDEEPVDVTITSDVLIAGLPSGLVV